MPQLDPTHFASQLFWLFVSIAFLYLMLKNFLLPKIGGIFHDRKVKVEKDIERAEHARKEASSIEDEYLKDLKKARLESAQMIALAASDIKKKADEKIAELEDSISLKFEQSRKNIEEVKNKSLDELKILTHNLASEMTKKLVG